MLDELGSFYFTNYYFGWGLAGSRNWAVWDGSESTEHWRRCDSLKGRKFSSENKDCSYPGSQVIHRLTREASMLKSKPRKKKKKASPFFLWEGITYWSSGCLEKRPQPVSLFLLCERGSEHSGEWNIGVSEMLPKQFSDSICRVMSLPQALGEGRLKHAVESWAKACVVYTGRWVDGGMNLISVNWWNSDGENVCSFISPAIILYFPSHLNIIIDFTHHFVSLIREFLGS